jgi:hypothetical protein
LSETHFGILQDPRALHSIEHKLIDIVIITICGADNWEAIAEYGRTKDDWLKTFLALPNGIPSADTFIRVFARLSPEALQSCFIGWMQAVHQVTEGELLSIDGKTLRGAKEAGNSRSFIHMLSAWSASHHLVLAQQKVSEKSNEITAIPPLLELLALKTFAITEALVVMIYSLIHHRRTDFAKAPIVREIFFQSHKLHNIEAVVNPATLMSGMNQISLLEHF